MSTLNELREQRRQDKAADAEIRRQDAAAAATRRREERAAAMQFREGARRARRERWATRRANLPNLGMAALWATMIVLPIALAWSAQAKFAEATLQISSPFNHAFPASIEVGAWLCAFEAHRRIRAGRDAGSLPRWMWVLAGVAAVINAAHGITDAGLDAGLALGALSLLGVLLHSIRQNLDAVTTGAADGRRGMHLLRTLRYPRLSFAAASIRLARELDHHTAWNLAWADRFGVGPDSTRRERRLARLVVGRETRTDRKAARNGELMIVDGRVQRTQLWHVGRFVRDTEPTYAHQAAALPSAQQTGDPDVRKSETLELTESQSTEVPNSETPPEQGELSRRAAELLPAVREAIDSGELPNPVSVKRLRAWAKERQEPMGVPVAQELRTALSDTALVLPMPRKEVA